MFTPPRSGKGKSCAPSQFRTPRALSLRSLRQPLAPSWSFLLLASWSLSVVRGPWALSLLGGAGRLGVPFLGACLAVPSSGLPAGRPPPQGCFARRLLLQGRSLCGSSFWSSPGGSFFRAVCLAVLSSCCAFGWFSLPLLLSRSSLSWFGGFCSRNLLQPVLPTTFVGSTLLGTSSLAQFLIN